MEDVRGASGFMNKYDILIVGSGLFGATVAYRLSKAGKKVLVLEKREHLGGNVYCEKVEGINVHKYGAKGFKGNTHDKRLVVGGCVGNGSAEVVLRIAHRGAGVLVGRFKGIWVLNDVAEIVELIMIGEIALDGKRVRADAVDVTSLGSLTRAPFVAQYIGCKILVFLLCFGIAVVPKVGGNISTRNEDIAAAVKQGFQLVLHGCSESLELQWENAATSHLGLFLLAEDEVNGLTTAVCSRRVLVFKGFIAA